ncbi:MAG: SusC/RagA family TonB-linked outer membrane protein [Muribaculaceae bacterium]|nr:SusC/RagA family TonB-linked outer membrane protein [Muribaculaceae bacterium]
MKKFLFMLLAVLTATLGAYAQNRTVTGTVTDEGGDPIVGATVLVEGTTLGTQTDMDGRFRIANVPSSAQTLRVSYVGMTSQTVKIVPGEIKVVLGTDSEVLDEVVVTAMGISRSEKSLGYSATQVGAAEIEKSQTSNVMAALQGKVAGLQVQTTSNEPGSANNVNIRGLGSISGNNQPLYVVDGVPLASTTLYTGGRAVAAGGVNNIAPDDIASLTVLKGAAATALYGSRASNGVIIITTKSGGAGESKNFEVTYSGNVEASRVAYIPKSQDRYGMGWNGNQTFIENGSWGPELNGSMQVYGPIWNGQQLIHKYEAVPNRVRDFFDTGVSQNHNVAISGQSTDKALNYYASYSFTDNDGIIPTDVDSYRRNTIATRASFQPSKWFKVSTSMNLATARTKVSSLSSYNITGALYEHPADIPMQWYKDTSSPFATPEAYYTPYDFTNPYWQLENRKNETNSKQVYGKAQLDIFPITGMTLTYRFGFDYSDYDYKSATPQIALDDAMIDSNYDTPPSSMNSQGSVSTQYGRSYEINHDFLANYTRKFLDDRLDMAAVVGVNINERASNYMYGTTEDLSINTGFWMLSNGANRSSLGESWSKRRLVGLFGDVTLGWDEFLFLDVTARNDWSSTLPMTMNSYFYPGVTLSGIFTKFIENKDVLSFGKVRLAYGKTGSDASVYRTLTTYSIASSYGSTGGLAFPLNGVNSFQQSASAGNGILRPEMTTEFEVGANLKFFNGRIDIDAAYYNRDTKDQIFSLPSDPATGFSSRVVNFGTVRNRGVELMANFIPVETRDWTWELGVNWTKNYNTVLSMPDGLEDGKLSISGLDYVGTSYMGMTLYAVEGKPLGEFWTTLPNYVTDENSPYYGYKIVNKNGTPSMDYDKKPTGYNMQHKWTGGITTSLRYKNVTLSAALDVRYGGKMYSSTKSALFFNGYSYLSDYNQRHPFILPNTVVDNGDGTYSENTMPFTYGSNYGYTSMQDFWYSYVNGEGSAFYLVDRTYTKLRNLSLTWSLPKKWLKKVQLTGVDITAYGNNLFIWRAKNNPFVDPEVSTSGSSSSDLAYGFGESNTMTPYTRVFGCNLKVIF